MKSKKKYIGALAIFITAFAIISTSCKKDDGNEGNDCFGAVACYTFNGNANDQSGNNHNGTVTGATLTSDRKGNANSAYHFASGAEFIDLPFFSSIIGGGDEFSISLWSKAETQQSNTVFALFPDNASDRLLAHVNYFTAPNVTKIIFDVGNFSSGRHELLNQVFTSNWEHYVFVASQSQDIIKVYRNGVLIIDETGYIASTKTRALRIGAPFYGNIDDVRIFNRVLNLSEISDLFNE